jgi:Nuclease-related domain
MPEWKLIKAKRASRCELCHLDFGVGEDIYWNKARSVIRCLSCGVDDDKPRLVETGEAGNSAQQQYGKMTARTRKAREDLFGKRVGKIADVILGETQNAKAWGKGAEGERYVGNILRDLCEENDFRVLHDRRIPNSKANIDHILITNRGVFVVDAKNYEGLVRIDQQGGILSPLVKTLYVGNRKQTKLVEGVKRQVSILQNLLSEGNFETPVHGVLAFYDAEWPIFFKPTEIDGVLINSKGIKKAVLEQGIVSHIDVDELFIYLKNEFPAK